MRYGQVEEHFIIMIGFLSNLDSVAKRARCEDSLYLDEIDLILEKSSLLCYVYPKPKLSLASLINPYLVRKAQAHWKCDD